MDGTDETKINQPGNWMLVAAAWTAVCLPLGWGIYQTLKKALILFN